MNKKTRVKIKQEIHTEHNTVLYRETDSLNILEVLILQFF